MNKITDDRIRKPKYPSKEDYKDVFVVPRYGRLLQALDRHGYLSNHQLFQVTSDTQRNRSKLNYATRRMRTGQLIDLPRGQLLTAANSNYHSYIYGVGKKGAEWLDSIGPRAIRAKASNSFWHDYLVSTVTASIDLLATRAGMTFHPTRELLDRADASYTIPVDGVDVDPDAVFGLSKGAEPTYYALEVDLGNEDIHESKKNKYKKAVLERKLRHYHRIVGDGRYKRHYRLQKAGMVVLFVFNSHAREQTFLKMTGGARYIATKTIPGYTDAMKSLDLLPNVFEGPWNRDGHPPLYLNQ